MSLLVHTYAWIKRYRSKYDYDAKNVVPFIGTDEHSQPKKFYAALNCIVLYNVFTPTRNTQRFNYASQ